MKTIDTLTKATSLSCTKYLAVKAGKAMATNLDQALVMPTSLPDGVYDKNNIATQEFELDDMPELGDTYDISKMTMLGNYSETEAKTMANTIRACSKDGTRPALTGVLFDKKYAVACDGYILSLQILRLDLGDRTLLVPKQAIELAGMMFKDFGAEQLEVYSDFESTIAFVAPNGAVLYSQLINARYPEWRQIINN